MNSTIPQIEFIPGKISEGKPILLIEKSQFGLSLTQEAIDVSKKFQIILKQFFKEMSKYDLKTWISPKIKVSIKRIEKVY